MTRFEGYSFRMGVIATSASDDKQWYGLNFVGFGDAPGLSSKEYQPHFGFAARPVDADADGVGCNGLFTNSGGFSWLAHDPRYNAKCPALEQGSSVHWSSDGQSLLLDTKTHTASLYVPRGESAHELTLGEDGSGNELFEVLCADGSRLKSAVDGWTIQHTGMARVHVGPSKTDITGSATVSLDLTVGGPAGLPVVNATAFGALLTTLGTALNAATPVTPYEISLQAALLALIGAFAGTCPTTMLKAV